MVRLIFVLAFFIISSAFAQETYEFDASVAYRLDEALIRKDTAMLSELLHANLTMGHSNGWLETKTDLLQTLASGELTYKTILKSSGVTVFHQSDSLAVTRRNIDVNGLLQENTFEVQLNVLEVWLFENNRWQLLSRQSVNRKE